MVKIKPLSLNVNARLGESATSLASRLARRNGAPRLINFCTDKGTLSPGDVETRQLNLNEAGV